jgi:hypothetical protein
MIISQIINLLDLKILAEGKDTDILDGYTADLLSDVIANAKENCVWITVQRHLNILAVAQLKKISAIIITGKSYPDEKLLEKAKEEKIYILKTDKSSFEISGKLYGFIKK